jgi:peptidoglycan/LPS O-acetylase OafA/YrhL
MAYPLYLLHMQAGYVIFLATGPSRNPALAATLILCGAVVLALAVWRFVERPLHRWTKNRLTAYAGTRGWQSRSVRERPTP